jgi:hypothetical protein
MITTAEFRDISVVHLRRPFWLVRMTLQSETGRLDEGDPEVMNEWFKVFHETSSRLDVCRWCDGHHVAGCLLIKDESGRTVTRLYDRNGWKFAVLEAG